MTDDECRAMYLNLLEKSENRIDRTNEMICKLVECVNKNEKQIQNLTDALHSTLNQNESLIKAIEDKERKLAIYENLLQNIIKQQFTSSNTINVTQ